MPTSLVRLTPVVWAGPPRAIEGSGGADEGTIVDDPAVADVVLEVGYTFAWDYPFSLKYQDTSVVLVSGKGSGPFSGPAGATSVASEFAKLLKAYRVTPPQSAGKEK